MLSQFKMIFFRKGPDSSVVEHLHGKQAVVGSIPTLGKEIKRNIYQKLLQPYGGK